MPFTKDISLVLRGPVRVFYNVALPAEDVAPTLAADGSPDATASPNAKYVGFCKDGASLSVKRKTSPRESDDFAGPYDEPVLEEDAMIEIATFQVADVIATAPFIGNTVTASGTHFELMSGGGILNLVKVPVLCVVPTFTDPTKFAWFILFAASNMNGIEFKLDKKSDVAQKLSFKGFYVPTRSAGRQLYAYGRQI